MGRLDELIIEGNELLDNLTKEKSSDINKWISETLLYVEKKFPKTEFAKFFISDVESFRQQMIAYDIFDKEAFERLISHLNAILSHQNTMEKENEDLMSTLNKMK
ncbi:hypothetical protein ACFRH9_17250 [Peribacillus butanolivorans]|uniref:hypothetical protein n=1 Tax=Peribacillus butanolivorans TaxID=421767 RepID=UPI00366F5AAC